MNDKVDEVDGHVDAIESMLTDIRARLDSGTMKHQADRVGERVDELADLARDGE